MPRSIRPWPANAECPEPGFADFKRFLNQASYHNAAEGTGEAGDAHYNVQCAAQIAIIQDWPYWVMDRMFREIAPLVAWESFMQFYINELRNPPK